MINIINYNQVLLYNQYEADISIRNFSNEDTVTESETKELAKIEISEATLQDDNIEESDWFHNKKNNR